MKLYSPQLERALRKRVRQEIKKSAELKREAKNRRPRRVNSDLGLSVLLASMFLIGGMVGAGNRGGEKLQLLWLTLLSMIVVIWMVNLLFLSLGSENDLNAFSFLPISDESIFDHQWRVFLRKSIGFLVMFVVLFACVGLTNTAKDFNFNLWWMVVLVCGVLHWLVSIISATLLASYFPTLPYPLLGGMGMITIFVLVIANSALKSFYGWIEKLLDTPYWIVPTGWTAVLFENLHSRNYLAVAIGLGLAFLYFLSLKPALARMKADYHLQEPIRPTAENLAVADEEDLQAMGGIDLPEAFGTGETEIEDNIRGRTFLQTRPTSEPSGLNGFITRWMNPRDRQLLELAEVEIQWAVQWRKAAFFVIGIIVFTLAARLSSYSPPKMWFFIISFFLGKNALPLGNPLTRVFWPLAFSGTQVPWYTGFPISFQDISKLILKLHNLRLLVFIPLLLIYGISSGLLYHNWQNGLVITLKGIWLLMVLQPICVVSYFSTGTNDSSRSGCLPLLATFAGLMSILVCIGIGIAFVFVESALMTILCGTLSAAISFGFYRVYRWAFSRGRFDVMKAM